jgi:hypothetical protein
VPSLCQSLEHAASQQPDPHPRCKHNYITTVAITLIVKRCAYLTALGPRSVPLLGAPCSSSRLRLRGNSPAVGQSVPQWPLNDEYPFGLAFRTGSNLSYHSARPHLQPPNSVFVSSSLHANSCPAPRTRRRSFAWGYCFDTSCCVCSLGGMWGALTAVRGFVSLSEGP